MKEMLEFCGSPNIDQLVRDAIPASIRDPKALEDSPINHGIP